MQIIGEKIRCFKNGHPQKHFNHLYYASILKKKADEKRYNKLFLEKSIQKLIDSQWTQTWFINLVLFLFYLVLFFIPLNIIQFDVDEQVKVMLLKMTIVPACVLLLYESIQIRLQGWAYFKGCNLVHFG